jgi:hypothetical protein
MLAANPPWREWFLTELGKRQPDAAAAMFRSLRAGPTPPTQAETRAYLRELVNRGAVTQAYLAWVQGLPPARQMALPLLFNGGFDQPLSGVPFDWTIDRIPGAATSIRTAVGGNGRTVMVEYADQRVAYRNLWQVLMLGPGRYTLHGRVRTIALENARGLVWRLYCLGKTDQPVAESDRFKGTADWQSFALSFEVPAEGCRGQVLRLEIATRIVLEQNISGRIWFDDMSIDRDREGEAAAQPVSTP